MSIILRYVVIGQNSCFRMVVAPWLQDETFELSIYDEQNCAKCIELKTLRNICIIMFGTDVSFWTL